MAQLNTLSSQATAGTTCGEWGLVVCISMCPLSCVLGMSHVTHVLRSSDSQRALAAEHQSQQLVQQWLDAANSHAQTAGTTNCVSQRAQGKTARLVACVLIVIWCQSSQSAIKFRDCRVSRDN